MEFILENECPSPDRSGNPFVPVPRLREAQKIETDSRKQLLKINIKTGFKLTRPET